MCWSRHKAALRGTIMFLMVLGVVSGIAGYGKKSASMLLGKNDVMFYGVTDNWVATYGWDYMTGNQAKIQITLQYKGSNAKAVGEVHSPPAPLPAEHDTVKAIIKWKGSEEKIELHQKK